ncbi:hypothetical protein CPB86DRAFT_861986 [Serendipita vermifera]|nr:hypothetical protein CPB86DRAFT_861986 [Serendipita vermifera]
MPATPTNTQNRACAECRRLKFILSNTQELHDKIEALQTRIKELEAALAQLQSKVTSEPHPLLTQSLKTATEGLEPEDDTATDNGSDNEDLVDTFGSLKIDPEGKTVWYGPHAGSEFLIPIKEGDQSTDNHSGLPVDILLLSRFFPFKNVYEAEDIIRSLVRSYLPPKEVAYESTFSVFSKLEWTTSAVVWDEFRRTIFEPIYGEECVANDQQIAVFFITMALCVLTDPTRPMYHPDAQRYYHLSRASMSLGEDILQSHSIYAVQYLKSLSTFSIMSNDPNGPNRAWGALSLAVRLAQMAGLPFIDRDNDQWDKYPEQAELRRRLWWDLVSGETIFGFAMGRPRAIYPAHYDTKMPKDDEDEGKTPSYEAFAVKPPPYATILKLDKDLRNWKFVGVPTWNQLPTTEGAEVDPKLLLWSLSTSGLREISLMYLHRRYFVNALTKRPNEPLRSKYAMSVLAVHRSAILLLQGIMHSSAVVEKIFARMSFMWVHALSAYLCLSAIVIKSPGCSLASSSLAEVSRMKEILTGVDTYRVLHAQPIIIKLYEQAHASMNKYKEGKWLPNTFTDEVDGDIMKFIGQTDFAHTKPQEVTASGNGGAYSGEPFGGDAHPALFEYMKWIESQDAGVASSASHPIPEQDIFSQVISEPADNIRGFDPLTSHRSFGHVNNRDGPGQHSEPSNLIDQTSHSTIWPSRSLYDDPTLHLDSLQGQAPNTLQDFLFHDLLLDHGAGPNQNNEQNSQDQLWEQFLSTLMS